LDFGFCKQNTLLRMNEKNETWSGTAFHAMHTIRRSLTDLPVALYCQVPSLQYQPADALAAIHLASSGCPGPSNGADRGYTWSQRHGSLTGLLRRYLVAFRS
jgi:hypothetical protein